MLRPDAETMLRSYAEREFGEKSFTQVAPGVFFVTGMALSNAIVLEGVESCILIDTLDSKERGERLRQVINEEIGKPVQTIIYTHIHPDHRGGGSAFAHTATEVIAFRPTQPPLPGMAKITPMLNKRGALQFGFILTDEEAIHQGIGPRAGRAYGEDAAPLKPTTLYSEPQVSRTIDGVNLELHFAPGETNDHCFVWLPEHRILCCGDNYYATFPNLYALRGTPYREVSHWIDALSQIIDQEAEILLPGHTRALFGKDTIRETLTNYRDAIASIYEQTLACLADDMTIEDTVTEVRLPDHLIDLPYLQEHYGTVAWSVRSIYNGHVGWFDGNPTSLEPLYPADRGERMVKLAGSRDALLKFIEQALADNDPQWAAELVDHLLALDPKDETARALKAQALDALAKLETSANGRHYYQIHAKILRGEIDENRWRKAGQLFQD